MRFDNYIDVKQYDLDNVEKRDKSIQFENVNRQDPINRLYKN